MRLSDITVFPSHAVSVSDIRIDEVPHRLASDGDTLIRVVCPACAQDMHEDCCGAGCYCDCQPHEDAFYDEGEDDTMIESGYAKRSGPSTIEATSYAMDGREVRQVHGTRTLLDFHPDASMRKLGYHRNPATCLHTHKTFRTKWVCKDCGVTV